MNNETPRSPISLDALVFALLCAAYLPMRFIIPSPPVIPGSVPATVILIAAVVGYFALDVINAQTVRARRRLLRLKWLLVVGAIGLINPRAVAAEHRRAAAIRAVPARARWSASD